MNPRSLYSVLAPAAASGFSCSIAAKFMPRPRRVRRRWHSRRHLDTQLIAVDTQRHAEHDREILGEVTGGKPGDDRIRRVGEELAEDRRRDVPLLVPVAVGERPEHDRRDALELPRETQLREHT